MSRLFKVKQMKEIVYRVKLGLMKLKLVIALLGVVVINLVSCEEAHEPKTEELVSEIPETIELDDYYLVEGDILVPKSKEVVNGKTEQANTNSLVAYSTQPSIRVYFNCSSNWWNEIQQALNDWTHVTNSRISFSRVVIESEADIMINNDNGTLPSNTIAAASSPQDGKAGTMIRINTDFNNGSISSSQKRYNMVHELGHCIGFRHTNWSSRGETVGTLGANTIPGTPTSDPNSVMNGGTADHSWAGFSSFDILAVRTVYPQNNPIPDGIISPNGGESYVGPNWGGYSTVTGFDINLLTTSFNPTRVAIELIDSSGRNWFYGVHTVSNGKVRLVNRFAGGSYWIKITDVDNPNNWGESNGTISILIL